MAENLDLNAEHDNGVLDTIAQNVVPITLTGIGVAWLISNIRESGGLESSGGSLNRVRSIGSLQAIRKGQDLASGTWHSAQNATSYVASKTRRTAGGVANQVGSQARKAQSGFQTAMRDNPLAVGAVALAVGALVGLVLPVTQRENELMGEARDNLLGKAQQLANDTVQQVQRVGQKVGERVVDEAGKTLKEEGKQQGLLV